MRSLIGLALALAVPGVAVADSANAQMVTSVSPMGLAETLRNAGYKAELTKDSSGDPMIRSASSGSNYTIYFYGCTQNVRCRSVQFHTSYNTNEAPALSLINSWNETKRFAKAYVDKEGDPHIEWDVDLDKGGVSTALFIDIVELWTESMSLFEKHISWK